MQQRKGSTVCIKLIWCLILFKTLTYQDILIVSFNDFSKFQTSSLESLKVFGKKEFELILELHGNKVPVSIWRILKVGNNQLFFPNYILIYLFQIWFILFLSLPTICYQAIKKKKYPFMSFHFYSQTEPKTPD